MIQRDIQRYALASAALVAAISFGLAWMVYDRQREQIVASAANDTVADLRAGLARFQGEIAALRAKIISLSDTPPLAGIARAEENYGYDPEERTPVSLWKDRLARIGIGLMRGSPALAQVRLLGPGGRELVRVERRGDTYVTPGDERLQDKSGRDYFLAARDLPPGGVHVSPLDLNIENGVAEQPPNPVIRVAMPVHKTDGSLIGVLVLNVSLRKALDDLHAQFDPDVTFMIVSPTGLMLGANGDQAFAVEPGEERAISDLVSQARAAPGENFATLVNLVGGELAGAAAQGFVMSDAPGAPVHAAVVVRTRTGALAAMRRLLAEAMIAVIALSAAAALAILLFARQLSLPLMRLTEATRELAAGRSAADVAWPRASVAEIEELTGVLRDMAFAAEARESAAVEREGKLRAMFDTSTSAFVTSDGAGRIEEVNAAALAMFGYRREELIGADITLLMTEREAARHDAYLERCRRTGDLRMIGASRREVARRRDGTVFPIRLDITRQERGAAHVFTAMIEDMSQLERNERAKGEFISMVSHELRTPLAAIKGALGLIRSRHMEELSPKPARMVELAASNCVRLVKLINDLLDIERIEAGKLRLDRIRFDLHDLAARVAEESRPMAAVRAIELRLAPAQGRAPIQGDPDRIGQVIANLISNAVKFSDAGDAVHLAVEERDGRWRLSVRDNGPGVPSELRGRIFGKFMQAESGDHRRPGGSGLGLSISKGIVEAHDGRIDYDSEQGGGSTFWFELPAPEHAPMPEADAPQPAAARRCVLVCEDRSGRLASTAGVCADLGYDTVRVLSVDAFKAIAADLQVDACIVDLSSSWTIEMVEEIARDPRLDHVRIILRTEADMDTGLAGALVPVADVVSVPIESPRFAKAIQRAVRGRAADTPAILHVEDERDQHVLLADMLGDLARIEVAATCAEATRMLRERDYDLVILDLNMPDGRGETLLDIIAQRPDHTPEVLIHSIEDAPAAQLARVAQGLVKSRLTPERLREQVSRLLARGGAEATGGNAAQEARNDA